MHENGGVMRRVLALGIVALVGTACSPGPTTANDEPVSTVDGLVGRWRALGSSETRVFLGDGTTWIEGATASGAGASQSRGSYRLISPGQLEVRSDGGTAQSWTVVVGYAGAKVLKLRDSDGRTTGYVEASTIPAYAPTTTTGKQ